jgi:hypothetical protein
MEPTLEHRIRQRAYELWHANGCAEGKAGEHWLAAEREVLSSSIAISSASEATVAPKRQKSARADRRVAKSTKSSAAA